MPLGVVEKQIGRRDAHTYESAAVVLGLFGGSVVEVQEALVSLVLAHLRARAVASWSSRVRSVEL